MRGSLSGVAARNPLQERTSGICFNAGMYCCARSNMRERTASSTPVFSAPLLSRGTDDQLPVAARLNVECNRIAGYRMRTLQVTKFHQLMVRESRERVR